MITNTDLRNEYASFKNRAFNQFCEGGFRADYTEWLEQKLIINNKIMSGDSVDESLTIKSKEKNLEIMVEEFASLIKENDEYKSRFGVLFLKSDSLKKELYTSLECDSELLVCMVLTLLKKDKTIAKYIIEAVMKYINQTP